MLLIKGLCLCFRAIRPISGIALSKLTMLLQEDTAPTEVVLILKYEVYMGVCRICIKVPEFSSKDTVFRIGYRERER